MRILSPKFPKLGINFWIGVIMTTSGSPIFPDWDEFPEEEPMAPVSVDQTVDIDGGDLPEDAGIPFQKASGVAGGGTPGRDGTPLIELEAHRSELLKSGALL